MEITLQKNNTIRIKTKNAIISLDKILQDSDIVIRTFYESLNTQDFITSSPLLIQGPGEYEIKGVSVTGRESNSHTIYEVNADSMKLLILPSTSIDTLEDDDEYTGIIIYMVSDIKDTIFSHTSTSAVILFGQTSWIHLPAENLKKSSKVNLKKKEEFEGAAVLLSL